MQSIIRHIEVGEGVLPHVPEWINSNGFSKTLVVSDENTYKAAGERLCKLLDGAGLDYESFIFKGESELCADELSVGQLCAAYRPEFNLILGVGSGTINDLCKFVAYRVGRPCAIAGTAPSMDGYAAKGAAMTLNGMKITPQTQCPTAIFCDTDILKNAPARMIAAGLGDMLGKLSALADWKLSHLLTGEPIPEDIAGMVSEAVQKCSASADAAARREPKAIENITEGLILSGLAMSMYGDSRPASGTEHHLAHYWEMKAVAEGKTPELHGLKVGVATLYALRMWQLLPETPQRPKPENRGEILKLVECEYGEAAAELLPVPNPNLPFELIEQNWGAILDIARSVPKPEEIAGLLKLVGAPLDAASVHVGPKLLRDSILLARERKKTYTLLQLLGDLGLLESFAGNSF